MNFSFISDDIPGWFDHIDNNIFTFLLNEQHKNNIQGNYAEIGVYHGKSLLNLCNNRLSESILAIDLYTDFLDNNKDTLDIVKQNIKKYSKISESNINFLRTDSTIYKPADDYLKSFKFIHLDACHNEYSVTKDLTLCDNMLNDNGILVLDDWTNLLYPGIQAAYYKTLANNYSILMISTHKCYICKKEKYNFYYTIIKQLVNYIIDNFPFLNITESINNIENNMFILTGTDYQINNSTSEYNINFSFSKKVKKYV